MICIAQVIAESLLPSQFCHSSCGTRTWDRWPTVIRKSFGMCCAAWLECGFVLQKSHSFSLIIQSTWQARCNHYLHILLKIKNISLACTEVALPVVKVCCGLCHDLSASILPSYKCLGGDPLPERNVPLRERPAICGYGCAKATGPLAETQFHP